ncbi:hypothetical protein [Pseudomonas sp. Marseille-QA0892]
MKWRQENPWLAISDVGYRVAKFVAGAEVMYRASIRGEFIGSVTDTFAEAKAICERHFQIMGMEDAA